MSNSVRALALSLRRVEYSLLFPFVFIATWLEHATHETRHALGVAVLSIAMMVAGICGVTIIKGFYI